MTTRRELITATVTGIAVVATGEMGNHPNLALAAPVDVPGLGTDVKDDAITFMSIKYTNGAGEMQNDKYFLGRLPSPGEAVDFVYIGENDHDGLRFMLKVRNP